MKKILTFYVTLCLLTGTCLLSSCKTDETDPTPDPKDPVELSIPTGVTCDVSAASLSFSWTAVANVATYKVELRDTEKAVVSAVVSAAAWVAEELEPESDYEFRVIACPIDDSKDYLNSQWSEWTTYSTGEGIVARKFASGDGTEDNPYIIKTPAQLALLAQLVNDEEEGYYEYGVYYELGADIDLKDYDEWIPIGIGTGSKCVGVANPQIVKGFRGRFNGASHKVSNLKVVMSGNSPEIYAGLFGLNCGWIEFVEVEGSVSAKSLYSAPEGGLLLVGGVCGRSGMGYGAGGALEVLQNTGGLVRCSFKGSIKADSNMDLNGRAVAGGICGYANSGNIDNCTVVVPEGKSIHVTSGSGPMAGGIIGYQAAGRLTSATVTIAGDVVSEYLTNIEPDPMSDDAAFAGGVLGSCGRLENGNAPSLGNCNVIVSGNIKALAPYATYGARVGALAGGSQSTLTSECQAVITGKIIAEANGNIYAGGLIGGFFMGYSSPNQLIGCTVDLKGEIVVKQLSESMSMTGVVHVGGIVGGVASGAAGTLGLCSVLIDGRIAVSATTTGNQPIRCGGVIGTSVAVLGSSAILTSKGVLEVSAKTIYIGGVAGMFQGGNVDKFMGNYAYLDGTIKTHPGAAGSSYTANIGGVASSLAGKRVGVKVQNATMTSCYAVVKAAIEAEATATVVKGAVASGGLNNILNTCYWWSADAGMFGYGQDTVDAAKAGTQKFASIDQAGYELAMIELNLQLLASGATVQFRYDAAKGYLVF